MASSQGFGKNSGPSAPTFSHNPFANLTPRVPEASPRMQSPLAFGSTRSITDLPYPATDVRRSIESSPRPNYGQKSFINNYNAKSHQNASTLSPLQSTVQDFSRISPQNVTGRQSISPQGFTPRPNVSVNTVNTQIHRRSSPPSYNIGAEASTTKPTRFPVPERERSPPLTYDLVYDGNSSFTQADDERRSLLPSYKISAEASTMKPANFSVSKRPRSPPLPPDQVFNGNSYSTQAGDKREEQAKAKRLARFKVELSQSKESSPDTGSAKFSANRSDQSIAERSKISGVPIGNDLSDYEGTESSNVIVGSCPDMCPDSERQERERKGDLDQHERVDGDRNQSSRSLAVKKYNRTAEREANLIRPLPILQKTIDYLLNLLDQPYDDKFLGMYNFLWDRMRAIRMDLRMQHIFNVEAITMLEQMIRLHIVAMHELCEYTKGEGLSEGFDAHLNIEQMNKTSVELFQMYDDHRKKGISVPTEREFRGYYALLKLDKHPGYKVEPAELSLDLAKMTSEIRQTPEVLFARNVARACRTGNFIAFFRLARKASYLQACLMHAHFAKLRTQALASLHCGLQNNQGIPVSHVAKWLGLEEEDPEGLLEYHGLSIKEFEEPYMVKEGHFLNGDKDYPTRCSELVHLKKSTNIIDDVASSSPQDSPEEKSYTQPKVYEHVIIPPHAVAMASLDEEMSDSEVASSPKELQTLKIPTISHQTEVNLSPWDFSLAHNSPKISPPKIGRSEKPISNSAHFDNPLESDIILDTSQNVFMGVNQVVVNFNLPVEYSESPGVVIEDVEEEEPIDDREVENDAFMESKHSEEAAEAKLKLMIRLWRRRSSRKRELRQQRQLAANVALNSLSLGPPILPTRTQQNTFGRFDIDTIVRERDEKHERSWSRLNVSDVIASLLVEKNPNVKYLCWKLALCSQMNGLEGNQLGHWLLSKLMPTTQNDVLDAPVISSPGLSIWKSWVPSHSGNFTGPVHCFSVIKNEIIENQMELGTSAVLFLVSDSIPWELQKTHLQKFLMSLPSGSRLPLLVLSGSHEEPSSDSSLHIAHELGLHNIDKSRIISFRVVSVNSDSFFSDGRLREGLQWLASDSPPQPILDLVKTRELVLTHLNPSMEVLQKMGFDSVGPAHCIAAFNEALDRTVGEVASAAHSNQNHWPCPEVDLLDDPMKLFLPSIGWSLNSQIEPLIRALSDCKLPSFTEEIENQRAEIENCLVRYLTQSSMMMGMELAKKEARVMIQSSSQLELRDSRYYIFPKWVSIFRRVFNWRLMDLSNGDFSAAYVLARGDVDVPILESFDESPPYCMYHPSLDEMVEVGDQDFSPTWVRSESHVLKSSEFVGVGPTTWNDVCGSGAESQLVVSAAGLDNSSGGLVVVPEATKEADRLSKLLEQCNILQDRIGEKLSIYF